MSPGVYRRGSRGAENRPFGAYARTPKAPAPIPTHRPVSSSDLVPPTGPVPPAGPSLAATSAPSAGSAPIAAPEPVPGRTATSSRADGAAAAADSLPASASPQAPADARRARDGLDSGFWAEKRVFLTGASGIVGSWLAVALVDAGATVHCLIRDVVPQSYLYLSGYGAKVVQIHGQVEDFATLERTINEYAIDTVFHLGAQTLVGTALRSPMATLRSNVAGTWNLLEAIRLHPDLVRRVVVASSDKAYGDHGGVPYTEEMALQGRHPYDVSKSCADLITQAYAQTYGLPVAIARCGNVFGGGDLNFDRLVPGTIRSALRGERPVIRSDGRCVREYLYAEDVALAYALLAQAAETPAVRGEAFNFGSGEPLTVLELVSAILAQMGRTDLKPVIANTAATAAGEIPVQTLSSQKARRVLGWQPNHGIPGALAATVRWYESFLQPSPQPLQQPLQQPTQTLPGIHA